MKSQVGPGSKELLTVDDLKNFINKDEVVIVGFFKKDTDLKKTFLQVADKLREKISFAHTTVEDILGNFNIKYVACIIIFFDFIIFNYFFY